MSIRYERQGLKIVKVVDAAPPVREPYPGARLDRAAALISQAATNLRQGAVRRNRWGFGQPVPNKPDPRRDLPGEDLKRARKAASLSQRELAAQWGLSRGLIGTIELGHRSCPLELADWARRTNAEQEQG